MQKNHTVCPKVITFVCFEKRHLRCFVVGKHFSSAVRTADLCSGCMTSSGDRTATFSYPVLPMDIDEEYANSVYKEA